MSNTYSQEIFLYTPPELNYQKTYILHRSYLAEKQRGKILKKLPINNICRVYRIWKYCQSSVEQFDREFDCVETHLSLRLRFYKVQYGEKVTLSF